MLAASSAMPEEKSTSPSDLDLVLAARAGGDAPFAELVERFAGLVRSLALALTGSWQTAEDIAQETFIVVWTRLGKMQEPERFRGWVCGITRNLVLKRHRSQRSENRWRRAVPASDADCPTPEPSALDQIISHEEERLM